ncbi:hypothetical protein DL546_009105 [Coniochaeta pulveracea]|uniref:Mediator of RNA polymerase II transcription subunit 4 n=1 Tax=Coniochaeta pulveracea TaxID=177199 RepID=A0A420YHB5_9PEZI|nr:hypothetical protein DL546_009105 [Coniochaeta pulveracea]
MDRYLDARFDGMERALQALINSIASFNPSISPAQDLVTAQEELNAGLGELEKHQNNYRRIQQLQEETERLDKQIKDSLMEVFKTRQEIKATTVTKYPPSKPGMDFSYQDLVNYASRISRTTMPPPGVTNGVDLSGRSDGNYTPTVGVATGSFTVPNDQSPVTGAGQTAGNSTGQEGSSSTPQPQAHTSGGSTALPEHMLRATNLLDGAQFYPWPTEQQIRAGALAACQRLADQGIDPKNYDPDEQERLRKEAELEQQRQAAAEEEARRERERLAAEQRQRERERVAREPPRKQFQFAGGLDDDDDED